LKPYVFGAENYPHFLHVMAILFVLNVAIMLIIGKLYPRKQAYQQVFTHDVDITPWRYLKLFSLVIVVIVVSIYFYFA
jgi:SSS family solute:Na+ symporter